jgi:tripartite-type tricarboxylate transporter receptor subunit TctC
VVWGQIFGIAGAPQLDPTVVAWWDERIAQLVQHPEWKATLASNFLGGEYMNSQQSKAYLAKMHEGRLAVLRQLGQAKM